MTHSQILSTSSSDEHQKAAEKLRAGHLVAFPTETVYGLGADATNESAVKKIYAVKGRPIHHPLIVHISSMDKLDIWARDIPEYALSLARTFWPGPMTLILKRKKIAKDFVTGGQESVGIRVPSNPIAMDLLKKFESLGGFGVAAPSANRFGQVSPTSVQDVREEIGEYLGNLDLILDGEHSEIGIESTIIDCRDSIPAILRPGVITEEMIKSVVQRVYVTSLLKNTRVSGNLEKHYAPKVKVIINQKPKPGQAFVALCGVETPEGVIRIFSPGNSADFAKKIYSVMRSADVLGFDELVIRIPEGKGIEVALLDRLTKAAMGR
jgi:L-threonylcarbamoyladenylate synthase